MDPKTKQTLLSYAGKKSAAEIAGILGLKERQVRKILARHEEKQSRSSSAYPLDDPSPPKGHHPKLILLLFLVLGFLIYSNTFQAVFHFDDNRNIVSNQAIRNLGNLQAIWNWGPDRFLTNLSLAVNFHFGGLNVFGYHLVNIAIHVTAAVMVYFLVWTLFRTPTFRTHSLHEYAETIALFCGLLFLAHPIQTQAVTYIVQRGASLAALFYITACFLYLKAKIEQNKKLYWLAALVSALAMLTKPNVITLPVMILFCDLFLFPKTKTQSWQERFTYLAPFLVTFAVLPIMFLHGFKGHAAGQFYETNTIRPVHYLLTQFNVIVTYLRIVFLAEAQSLYHNFPISKTFFEIKTFLCFGFLASLFMAGVLLRKKHPPITFGIFWFFLALSIESSIFPIEHVIFEHRMYLPMAGFCLAFITACYIFFKKKQLVSFVLIAIVIGLCVKTYQRNAVWQTEESLWVDAAKSYNIASPNRRLFVDERTQEGVIERRENKPFSEWSHDAQ